MEGQILPAGAAGAVAGAVSAVLPSAGIAGAAMGAVVWLNIGGIEAGINGLIGGGSTPCGCQLNE